jgi:predicted esterase
MNRARLCLAVACVAALGIWAGAAESHAASGADDIELTETVPVAMSHRMDFVRQHGSPEALKAGVWRVDPALWQAAVAKVGEGPKEDVTFHLWLPAGIDVVRGAVAITGHGAGTPLYKHAELRKLARELKLALFMFNGNPMQRGFLPSSLLYCKLLEFGAKSKHPELEHAPLFLFGHSNGTGFSAVFTSTEAKRVWGWISMRPGTTMMVDQPGAAEVPGMIMFGEDDPFFAQKSKQGNMAVVERMRKDHGVLWHAVVEPKTAHGPGEKSWTLVFSFLRHSFDARVPADADTRSGPVTLIALKPEQGYLGKNWSIETGGYQKLPTTPFAAFAGDKSTASWLMNAVYAADWQQFQSEGAVERGAAK